MRRSYDVVIIGGGPAGSTAATFLARNGHSVLIVEREKFPRFHIGESLLPHSMSAFERLGILDKLEDRFLRKIGVEIATSCGTRRVNFRFEKAFKRTAPYTFQVRRSEFDHILLENAVNNGAELAGEAAVREVRFSGNGALLTLVKSSGESIECLADYVIDGSGRHSLLGNHFKLKRPIAHLQKFSLYAHFSDLPQVGEDDRKLIRLIRGANAWYWYIPISQTKTSVGMVMNTRDFQCLTKSREEILEEFLAAEPATRELLGSKPRRISDVYAAGDYSYTMVRMTGERWMLAGDAAGFIDPIFSTGVFLAIFSGEECANAIHAALQKPGRRAILFSRYERKIRRVMRKYQRFVNAWYSQEFIEVFTNPEGGPLDVVPAINTVLSGDVRYSFGVWWRLQFFYLVVYLQRFFPLVPRITLTPPVLKST
jgi:flavin-dependent dehydrogenase